MPVATVVVPPASSTSAVQSAAVSTSVLDSGMAEDQVAGTDIRPTSEAWPTLASTGAPTAEVPAGATAPANPPPRPALRPAGTEAAAAEPAVEAFCAAARPIPPMMPLDPKPTAAPV